jgi:hypothetical protein
MLAISRCVVARLRLATSSALHGSATAPLESGHAKKTIFLPQFTPFYRASQHNRKAQNIQRISGRSPLLAESTRVFSCGLAAFRTLGMARGDNIF